jgi:predicted MPP superfamily phosphohydrolase
MKHLFFSALSSLVAGLLLLLPYSSTPGNIVHPYRAVPVIVKTGEGFDILIRSHCPSGIDSVVLSGPFYRSKLAVDSIVAGRFICDSFTGFSVNHKISVTVPDSLPEDMYNLIVFRCGGSDTSVASVKVIRDFQPIHRFIHISDPHISRQWEGTAEDGYAKELELFDRFVDVSNIIYPDFVIVTGDLIHHYTLFDADSTGWGDNKKYSPDDKPGADEKYKNYFEGAKGFSGTSGLNSPVFSLPGNHDFYGVPREDHLAMATQWNQLCGLRVYGVSYEGTRILAADDYLGDPVSDIPDSMPMSGLQGKLLESYLTEKGKGDFRIMAQHRPDRIDTSFIDRHEINLLLNGHRHNPFEEYVGATPTLSSRPGTVCRSGEITRWQETLGFFRIFTIHKDSMEYSPPLRFCEDPTLPYNQLKMNLTLDYLHANDGKAEANEAVIANSFDTGLSGCRIRFVMKKGDYSVTGGALRQAFASGEITVIDVITDVAARSKAKVIVSRRQGGW